MLRPQRVNDGGDKNSARNRLVAFLHHHRFHRFSVLMQHSCFIWQKTETPFLPSIKQIFLLVYFSPPFLLHIRAAKENREKNKKEEREGKRRRKQYTFLLFLSFFFFFSTKARNIIVIKIQECSLQQTLPFLYTSSNQFLLHCVSPKAAQADQDETSRKTLASGSIPALALEVQKSNVKSANLLYIFIFLLSISSTIACNWCFTF